MIKILSEVRSNAGRLFFVGVGGGAGNANHAVCDFRKLAGIESYSVSDNVSELTARVNDDGWDTSYANWLKVSRISSNDAVFVFSVGGGNREKNVSVNLVQALIVAEEAGAKIVGVVGRDGGYAAQVADACVVVPPINSSTVTPHTEAYQAVIWHLMVSHPALLTGEMKWETGVGESLRSLSAAGYELFVTTNQPDHAKGKTTLENILAVRDAFEEKLRQLGVTLTDSYYCLCHPDGTTPGYGAPCACYKPSSHMVEKLAAAHNIDIGTSWMVGDRDGDMICGKGAGLRTIRLPDANPEAAAGEGEKGDYQATDIVEATAIILQRHDERIDGAEIEAIKKAYKDPMIAGFTTNPTLMRKAGIVDYTAFAKEVISEIPDKPISFEVFSDDLESMEREAEVIHSWGGNTYIKIPVSNTKGEATYDLISKLSGKGMRLNVTAVFTLDQTKAVSQALADGTDAIISIFAGRIADTGADPEPLMREAVELTSGKPEQEILWASPRELLNVFQADRCGCHIITATPDILNKLQGVGKDHTQFSLETVQMFYNDAVAAGYQI
eukprot:s1_g1457.t1